MKKDLRIQSDKRDAALGSDAASYGCSAISDASPIFALLSILTALGCLDNTPTPEPGSTIPLATGVSVQVAMRPSLAERYCAWYGALGPDDVLYFGEAAFWSAKAEAGGGPTAHPRRPRPQLVRRFGLAPEPSPPPLSRGRPPSPSGPP